MSIKTYGKTIAGKHPREAPIMTTIFAWLKKNHPEYFKVAVHVRNENDGDYEKTKKAKMQGGFVKGAVDILIIAKTPFACEVKTLNHGSKPTVEQIEFLNQVDKLGGFACVCHGVDAFIEAFEDWIKEAPLS